jgi:hypothetical protein
VTLKDRLGATLKDHLGATLKDRLGATLKDCLDATLKDRLGATLGDCLGATLRDRLCATLKDRLGASLKDPSETILKDCPGRESIQNSILPINVVNMTANLMNLQMLQNCHNKSDIVTTQLYLKHLGIIVNFHTETVGII